MTSYKATESKREEFRKYLEKAGVMDVLTKVLVGLYEEPEKPADAVNYVKKLINEGEAGEAGEDADLKEEIEQLKAKIQELSEENDDLKAKLAAFEGEKGEEEGEAEGEAAAESPTEETEPAAAAEEEGEAETEMETEKSPADTATTEVEVDKKATTKKE